ncbi:GNAT family N-acetyltransferase [Candidatus Nitrotoga sp. 1052]|uniref:GNAT family N-acetyltransferase n=1 Tax=Candidatus Nitrotoga sp. 1052 TaxID=2886964 RepID=UPI001EF4B9B5|nr:GNAT family N-acetyltransferase [Candidatus Nitrotoga sp. 1052]CAH1073311.1 GCN5-related N-acetyltransferase; Histone acetyltransferase HPA2 and related acetyltransferases [Candidatus Nitrotoga sp. 1052]
MTYCIRPLDAFINAADFQCGSEPLNDYIRRYASQDVRRNISRVFIATPENDPRQLSGFFTLSAGSVSCSSLPASLARKLPHYPVPVALIGRLGVDKKFQGKGLGSILLADACQKVSQASTVLAVAGIIIDAKDDDAISFYKHFGFIPLQGQAGRMLLPASVFQAK